MRRLRHLAISLGLLAEVAQANAQAGVRPVIPPGTGGMEALLRKVGVEERYDTSIPLDVQLFDHEGQLRSFASMWKGDRPAVLQFAYFRCAVTCDLALNGLVSVLIQQPRSAGIDLDVFIVSIDPRDTPKDAKEVRERLLGRYGRKEAESGFYVLTGSENEVARIAEAVGYRFVWDPGTEQYLHPAVTILLRAGPRPQVARYLFGIEHSPTDFRIGLAEAAQGHRLSPVEAALLYCYRYDPSQGRYVVMAWRIMRIGGALAALLLFGGLVLFWRNEAKGRTMRITETSKCNK
ncbi:MAG: SCO family protein [Sandaracinaceae bacterium]|nr:SCO family protein [Sandaracinaceae bacterium]